jgi:hypothetical protein
VTGCRKPIKNSDLERNKKMEFLVQDYHKQQEVEGKIHADTVDIDDDEEEAL